MSDYFLNVKFLGVNCCYIFKPPPVGGAAPSSSTSFLELMSYNSFAKQPKQEQNLVLNATNVVMLHISVSVLFWL